MPIIVRSRVVQIDYVNAIRDSVKNGRGWEMNL